MRGSHALLLSDEGGSGVPSMVAPQRSRGQWIQGGGYHQPRGLARARGSVGGACRGMWNGGSAPTSFLGTAAFCTDGPPFGEEVDESSEPRTARDHSSVSRWPLVGLGGAGDRPEERGRVRLQGSRWRQPRPVGRWGVPWVAPPAEGEGHPQRPKDPRAGCLCVSVVGQSRTCSERWTVRD